MNVGVIGVGKWGVNHVKSYVELGHKVFVYDAVPGRAAEVATPLGANAVPDLKTLFDNCEALSVVVPTDLHHTIVSQCLEAGKHVLVEKPLAATSEQVIQLRDLAKRQKRTLAVGHIFRFNPSVKTVKELLPKAGPLQYGTMRYMHSAKPPRTDSGVVFNFASHLFDVLDFIIPKRIERIYCKKKNFLSPQREDAAFIVADYGGFMVEMEVSWLHPLKARDAWFIAERDKVYVEMLEQKVETQEISITPGKVDAKEKRQIPVTFKEPLKEELSNFLQAATKGSRPVNDADNGYRVVRYCELALESAEKGKEVEVRDL